MTEKVRQGRDQPISKPRAFLRWVGGKQNLIQRLLPFLPPNVESTTYHEPFVGAGNLFFALRPQSSIISDLNPHLIDTYKHVRDDVSIVSAHLRVHQKKDSEKYYYKIRDVYNRSSSGAAQTARFIYLNRTCFNGIFRVNTNGEFNVPYGYKASPVFPSKSELVAVQSALLRSNLRARDYQHSLAEVRSGEFAYVDPPYPPLNGTSFFTHYTAGRFGTEDQKRLAGSLRALDKRGGLFLMTNADLPLIRDLYAGFNFTELRVTRFVSCKGARYQVSELVITNYEISNSTRMRQERTGC